MKLPIKFKLEGLYIDGKFIGKMSELSHDEVEEIFQAGMSFANKRMMDKWVEKANDYGHAMNILEEFGVRKTRKNLLKMVRAGCVANHLMGKSLYTYILEDLFRGYRDKKAVREHHLFEGVDTPDLCVGCKHYVPDDPDGLCCHEPDSLCVRA